MRVARTVVHLDLLGYWLVELKGFRMADWMAEKRDKMSADPMAERMEFLKAAPMAEMRVERKVAM